MNNPTNSSITARSALHRCGCQLRSCLLGALLPLTVHAAALDPLAFPSLGTFNPGVSASIFADGSTAPSLIVPGGATYTGVYFDQGGGLPPVAVFNFSSVNLAAGLTLGGTTSVPVALLSQGGLTIAGMVNANGFGGAAGGAGAPDTTSNGSPGGGPGGGLGGLGGGIVGNGGDGGSYGGSGYGNAGVLYGNLATSLQAGSGGGGSSGSQFGAIGNPGGAGGGGLELGAAGTLTLAATGALSAGGTQGASGSGQPGGAGGGGGSGRGVFLHGTTTNLAGSIDAIGAQGGTGSPAQGRAGGGGRVLVALPAFTVGTSVVPVVNVNVAGGPLGNQKAGDGTATLAVDVTTVPAGQTLNVTGGTLFGTSLAFSSNLVTVQGGGTFANLGGYTNPAGAQVSLTAADARITGGTFTNAGLLDGVAGRVEATVSNVAGGEIRAGGGSNLVFTASGNANAGAVNLLGGTVDFRAGLTNVGTLAGYGTLATGGGGLANTGTVSLSGNTDVLGVVANTGGGKLIATSGATATYFNAVTHNGAEVRTAVGSRTTFLGAVNGAGTFTGPGLVDFEGGYSPGNSPAAVSLAGDVLLGAGNHLTMELAGVTRGTQFDALLVAGKLTLGGALDVVPLNGFSASNGQQFDLLDWGTQTGTFSAVHLPALATGLSWDTTNLYSNGTIGVVPEPSTWALMILSTSLLTARGRRRR